MKSEDDEYEAAKADVAKFAKDFENSHEKDNFQILNQEIERLDNTSQTGEGYHRRDFDSNRRKSYLTAMLKYEPEEKN